MFSHFLTFLCVIPFLYFGAKAVKYTSGLIEARRFAASQSLPTVLVYNQRGDLIFWLLSPWIAPILEALPFKMGHWVRYIKKDFAWDHKGALHREELGSDV
jgi:hypothetical protein